MELVRRVVDGGKISYKGREFEIPWPGSDAVPMRLSMRAEHEIPIYLATLSPAMLKLTGEIADGWLGTSFVPEGAGPGVLHPSRRRVGPQRAHPKRPRRVSVR